MLGAMSINRFFSCIILTFFLDYWLSPSTEHRDKNKNKKDNGQVK
jgi:hypothetical protein